MLAARLAGNSRPLPMIKDMAYAWRQTLFFLSRAPAEETEAFLRWADERLGDARPEPVAAVLSIVLGGLADVAAGGAFDAEGCSPKGRRLLGWTTGRHWVLDAVAV